MVDLQVDNTEDGKADDSDDDFPTVKELVHHHLQREVSVLEPPEPEHIQHFNDSILKARSTPYDLIQARLGNRWGTSSATPFAFPTPSPRWLGYEAQRLGPAPSAPRSALPSHHHGSFVQGKQLEPEMLPTLASARCSAIAVASRRNAS